MSREIGMVPKLFRAGDEWKLRGRCAEVDPEVFFPESGHKSLDDAKRVCGRCEVQRECLEWALATDERYGVWGGVSEGDRYKMKKKRRVKA